MSPDELQRRLTDLGPWDFAAAEQLANELVQSARAPLAALSPPACGPDGPMRRKAALLLADLAELGVLPRIAAADRLEHGDRRSDLLGEAYLAYRALEDQLLARLQVAMRDPTPVPPAPVPGPVETPRPPTRVCDEAFLLWRHLGDPDEPDADYRRFGLRFARLSERERNDMIADARRGRRP